MKPRSAKCKRYTTVKKEAFAQLLNHDQSCYFLTVFPYILVLVFSFLFSFYMKFIVGSVDFFSCLVNDDMHWALSSFNCTFDGNAQPRKLCLTTHNIKEGLIGKFIGSWCCILFTLFLTAGLKSFDVKSYFFLLLGKESSLRIS